MKSDFLLKCWAVCVLGLLPSQSYEVGSTSTLMHVQAVRTVVIDAGHGGKDSGSLGKKTKEKDVSLKIALLLGEYIDTYLPNIKVVYTRQSDKFLELHERAQLANDYKADVFISIHCNSLLKRNEKISGSETYVMGLHTAEENLEVAKRENAVILLEDNYQRHYEGYDPNSPEAHIMLSMYQNAHLKQSLSLAEKIENQFTARATRPSRGVKQAGFMVLRATAMPSVLVETGFLSNTKDEQYLASHKGQVYIASAIYRAFRQYVEELEQGKITYTKPAPLVHSTPAPDPKPTLPNGTIVYKVQLASSPTPLDTQTGKLKGIANLTTEQHDKRYKYVVGAVSTFAQAVQLQNQWRAKGFKDAFIVSYKGAQRIALDEAKRLEAKK